MHVRRKYEGSEEDAPLYNNLEGNHRAMEGARDGARLEKGPA